MTEPTATWGHVINGSSLAGVRGLLQEYDPATGRLGYRVARGAEGDVAAAAKLAQPG